MSNNTLPIYVTNFRDAYLAMHEEYLKKGDLAFKTEDGADTPVYSNYVNAITDLVNAKMYTGAKEKGSGTSTALEDNELTNASSNRNMVISLRKSGEYIYNTIFIETDGSYDEDDEDEEELDIAHHISENNSKKITTDEILNILVEKILNQEKNSHYYLKKHNAVWAFNSICSTIHNRLCDMVKALPNSNRKKPNHTPSPTLVSLDKEVLDGDGNEATLADIIADKNQDTEKKALLTVCLDYAKNCFIKEVIDALLSTPHYLLAYLYDICDKSPRALYVDIITLGFDATLNKATASLKKLGIDLDYLNELNIPWEISNEELISNSKQVYSWTYAGRREAQRIRRKINIA